MLLNAPMSQMSRHRNIQKQIKTSCLVFFMSVLWVLSVCPVLRRFKFESHRFVSAVRLEYFPSPSTPSCTAPPPSSQAGHFCSLSEVSALLAAVLRFCRHLASVLPAKLSPRTMSTIDAPHVQVHHTEGLILEAWLVEIVGLDHLRWLKRSSPHLAWSWLL